MLEVDFFLPEMTLRPEYGLWKILMQKVAVVQKAEQWVRLERVEMEVRQAEEYFKRFLFVFTRTTLLWYSGIF